MNELPNHFKEAKSLTNLEIKFSNGQGGHVLVVSDLKLFPFKKKCTYVKKIKSVVIFLYF